MHKEQLSLLRQQPWFKEFVETTLSDRCPEVPEYTPGKSQQDWEYGSGMRLGFLLALKEFGVEIER